MSRKLNEFLYKVGVSNKNGTSDSDSRGASGSCSGNKNSSSSSNYSSSSNSSGGAFGGGGSIIVLFAPSFILLVTLF